MPLQLVGVPRGLDPTFDCTPDTVQSLVPSKMVVAAKVWIGTTNATAAEPLPKLAKSILRRANALTDELTLDSESMGKRASMSDPDVLRFSDMLTS